MEILAYIVMFIVIVALLIWMSAYWYNKGVQDTHEKVKPLLDYIQKSLEECCRLIEEDAER